MKKALILAAVMSAALVSASGASATILVATFKGALTGGSGGGYFGGSDLTNDAYVAQFTFDTSKGIFQTDGSYQYQYGGGCCASAPVSASLTIYEHEFVSAYSSGIIVPVTNTIDGSYESDAHNLYGNSITYFSSALQFGDYNATFYMTADIPNADIFSTVDLIDTHVYGNISLGLQDKYVTNLNISGNGTFEVTAEGVPEPASWALMIGGFGMAGAARPRRRSMLAA
jgi:hypothetical protein